MSKLNHKRARFSTLAAAGLLAAILFASPVSAGPGMMGACGDDDGLFGMMSARLDLTPEQTATIQEIRDSKRAEHADVKRELMKSRNRLQGEMLEDEPDLKKIRSIAKRQGELHAQMMVARIETRLAIRDVLTDEQRDMFFSAGVGQGCGKGHGKAFRGRGGQGPEFRGGPGHGRGGRGQGMGQGGPHGFSHGGSNCWW